MDATAFLAQRDEDLRGSDGRLAPIVAQALLARPAADWYAPIVEEAAQIWVEYHQAEAPGANFQGALTRFREALAESLEKTSDSTNPGRVTRWASTFTVNDGTITGAYARGIRFKMWRSMRDSDVRHLHTAVDGQVRPIGGLFDLGIARLPYPGAPSGPAEAWIECRCVVQPASREGEAMTSTTFTLDSGAFADDADEVPTANPDRPARAEYDGEEQYEYPMGGAAVTAAAFDMAGVIADVDEPILDEDLEDDEDVDEDEVDEIPVHGVLAPEGILTGDGRGFREGALSTRPLPVPLRLEIVGSHGGNQTSEVVTVGRVDEAWRDEATKMWRFRGAIILSKEYAHLAVEGMIDGSGRGVSIDADDMSVDMEGFEQDVEIAQAEGRQPNTWFSHARVAGLTIVPIPAFHEAYAGLGHEFEEDLTEEQVAEADAALVACGCSEGLAVVDLTELTEEELAAYDAMTVEGQMEYAREHDLIMASAAGPNIIDDHGQQVHFAPGTKDGPGWITHPQATSRIRRYWVRGKGAAKIRWGVPGDFNRCRRQLVKYVQRPDWLAGLCANMHKEALGIWPGQHRGSHGVVAAAGAPAPILALTASAEERAPFPAEYFQNPKFDRVTPMHIDKATGRVWGHLADWSTCHVGIPGVCTTPPRSSSNYAHFLKGVVDTTEGEQPVGTLTFGVGHPDVRMRASAAVAHYDRMEAVFAYVSIGEDAFGIWYSGVLRPGLGDDKIDEIRAIGQLSGDWRHFPRYGHDLIAAVAVNTGGYPIPALAASAGAMTALVAAGVVAPEVSQVGTEDFSSEENEKYLARTVVRALEMIETKKRAEAAQSRVRAMRLADVRERIKKGKV